MAPRAADLDALVELTFAVHDVLARVAARFDVSVVQVRLCGSLRGREPSMGELRQHLHLEKSSITGLIDRAQRRGLVERTTGHDDRRTIRVRLTAEGAALAQRVAAEVYAELDALLGPLAPKTRSDLAGIARIVLDGQTTAA
jgi:DNA-binding MarR family transcriptional regulator